VHVLAGIAPRGVCGAASSSRLRWTVSIPVESQRHRSPRPRRPLDGTDRRTSTGAPAASTSSRPAMIGRRPRRPARTSAG
jgi:hypothetical protein